MAKKLLQDKKSTFLPGHYSLLSYFKDSVNFIWWPIKSSILLSHFSNSVPSHGRPPPTALHPLHLRPGYITQGKLPPAVGLCHSCLLHSGAPSLDLLILSLDFQLKSLLFKASFSSLPNQTSYLTTGTSPTCSSMHYSSFPHFHK